MSSPVKFKNHVKVSERHGASEWLSERVLLLALMPLGLWVLSTIHTLAGADYSAVAAWFANTLNAVLAGLTLVVFSFLLNGARHLINDAGKGLDLKSANLMANIAVWAPLVLTVLFWVVLFAAGKVSL